MMSAAEVCIDSTSEIFPTCAIIKAMAIREEFTELLVNLYDTFLTNFDNISLAGFEDRLRGEPDTLNGLFSNQDTTHSIMEREVNSGTRE